MEGLSRAFAAVPGWPGLFAAEMAGAAVYVGELRDAAGWPAPSRTPGDEADAQSHPDPGRFLARRVVSRGLAAARLGASTETLAIRHDRRGAPKISGPLRPGHVSVAARGDLFAIAFAGQPVGIDLERAEADIDIPWGVLRQDEAAALKALPPPERAAAFLRLWTAKEAFLKARGEGLLCDPAEVWLRMGAGAAFVAALGGEGAEARGELALLMIGATACLVACCVMGRAEAA